MADIATNHIADYVDKMGVRLTVMSKETGISYEILRRSLSNRDRDLRADEFIEICNFLQKDPMDFSKAVST